MPANEKLRLLDEAAFDRDVANGRGAALVDFGADWCAPCRAIAPVIADVAEAFGDRAVVGKVDVDKEPGLAARFDIRSIPSLLFFQDGEIVERLQGLAPRSAIEEKLAALAASN